MTPKEEHRILASAEEGTTLILSISPEKIHISMVEFDEDKNWNIATWPVNVALEDDGAPCVAMWIENGEIHAKRVSDEYTLIDELVEAGGSITNI